MTKFAKIILIISVLFFISGGIFFYINSQKAPLYFYEGDAQSNTVGNQETVAKSDKGVTDSRQTVITETV